jgi:ribonuclease P protein component
MKGRSVGPVVSRATFLALRRPDGRSRQGPLHVRWVPLPGDNDEVQVSYVISKRCGNAVRRNRIRRRTKGAIALISQGIPAGAYLITTEAEVATMHFQELVERVTSALARAGGSEVRP